MVAHVHAMIFVVIFASFASVAFGVPGIATYYTVYTPSACYGYQEQGTMIAAVSRDIFQNRAACGTRYRVTCTGANCRGGSVTVRVVDLCPGCPSNGFDLSLPAFSAIADPNAGRITINYQRV